MKKTMVKKYYEFFADNWHKYDNNGLVDLNKLQNDFLLLYLKEKENEATSI